MCPFVHLVGADVLEFPECQAHGASEREIGKMPSPF